MGGNSRFGARLLRIRLARFGRRNLPFYRIYVANSESPRDGKHLEIVGTFDPIPQIDNNKHLTLNIERIKYWLSVGAQPSDRVAYLLGRAGVLPMPPQRPSFKMPKNPEKKYTKYAKAQRQYERMQAQGFAASGLPETEE